jgi:hypothetical protein
MPGDPKLLAHLQEIQHHLNALEHEIRGVTQAIERPHLVQLKPSADPAYGGLLLRVTQRSAFEVRGYLLLPRRGGSRETWLRCAPHDVTPIGRMVYPEAEYGFRAMDHVNQEALAALEESINKWAQSRRRRKPPQQEEARNVDDGRIHRSGDR